MSELELVRVDPYDEPSLRSWAELTAASAREEIGEHATAWAPEEILATAQEAGGLRRDLFFLGRLDGEPVATGWLALRLLDNLDGAELDVHVRPDLRRRGFGSAMLAHLEAVAAGEGRGRFDAEAQWPYAGPPDGAGSAGVEFARSHGYAFGIGDVQRVLDLPVAEEVLDDLARSCAPYHRDYEIRTWAGRIPDALVESWLEVSSTLLTEAPTGGMEREPEAVDVPAFRQSEQTQERQGRIAWHTVALDAGGRVVAYTQLVVPTHDRRFAYQWGTLVRGEHRGHRLGTVVKVENLRALQGAGGAGGRRVVTWNAEVNDHMIGINERLGFVKAARCGELQKRS